jgi:hypothetical protein
MVKVEDQCIGGHAATYEVPTYEVLRSSDAVQLASSLYLQREIGERILFAAFDDRLNSAARAEGLTLIDLS